MTKQSDDENPMEANLSGGNKRENRKSLPRRERARSTKDKEVGQNITL